MSELFNWYRDVEGRTRNERDWWYRDTRGNLLPEVTCWVPGRFTCGKYKVLVNQQWFDKMGPRLPSPDELKMWGLFCAYD